MTHLEIKNFLDGSCISVNSSGIKSFIHPIFSANELVIYFKGFPILALIEGGYQLPLRSDPNDSEESLFIPFESLTSKNLIKVLKFIGSQYQLIDNYSRYFPKEYLKRLMNIIENR